MLHLITGANGTGKTLFTLRWVRDLQLAAEKQGEHRPVFYNGRFKMKPEVAQEFDWQKFDFKDWQSLPDGSICIVDECHKDIPPHNAATQPPRHIVEIAEHRARGFDFFLMTQHPKNISGFVARLVGAPGWHRHLKRLGGAMPIVNILQWDAVDDKPERMSAKLSADVRKATFPKEVYKWYDSAVMHTGKTRVPVRLWIFLGLLVVCGYFGWSALNRLAGTSEDTSAQPAQAAPQLSAYQPLRPSPGQDQPLSQADYLATYIPRIPDLPHTAPRYDDITQPDTAPYPAACISMGERCNCYTQQGTAMAIAKDTCESIVSKGYFKDWGNQDNSDRKQNNLFPARDQNGSPFL